MAKDKKVKLTLTIPDGLFIKGEPTDKWYSYCIGCGHKTPCKVQQVFNCPECGYFVLILPCGVEI